MAETTDADPVDEPATAQAALDALTARYEADRLRWQLAVSAGGVGSFDWDLPSGRLDWDDQMLEVFGVGRHEFAGTIEAFEALVHPDDLPRVQSAISTAIDNVSQYVSEYRAVRGDGTTCWVKARGVVLAGPDGRPARMMGAAYDTTSEHDAEARVDRVLETMPGAFFLVDDDWRFSYVNSAAQRLVGLPRDRLLGAVVWEVFPAAVGSVFEENYRGARAEGRPRVFEAFAPTLERWFEVRAWPGPDGLSIYFDDVSDRRAAQDEARVARELAEASSRRLSLLAAVSDDLSSTLETEEAVRRLARHLVPTFGAWCLVTMSEDHRQLRDIAAWHEDPQLRATVTRYAALRINALAPDSYLFRALRTGEPVTVDDATESISRVLSGAAREVLRELAPRTAYAVPMRARERTVGAITLFLDDDSPDLDPDDLQLLVQLADRAGMALDNARLYQGQRDIAVGLQRSLLAAPVQPDDLQVVARYVAAAEAAQVGGDWYDAFVQPCGSTVLAIGDVMGHDTPAAAAMSQLRTLLRGIAHTTDGTPAEVLSGLDSAARALHIDAMATAVVMRLEQSDEQRRRGTTTLRWTNAGHPPAVLVAPDGTVRLLQSRPFERVLGLDPGVARTDHTIEVERGSTVVLYTDGLVERRGEPLVACLQRLQETLRGVLADVGAAARPAGPIDLDRMVDTLLERLTPGGEPDDDVALLAVHLLPQD